MSDWELLGQYREQNSNDAFRKLADRHMKLVYNTCRRDLDNAQAAEDATQLVFILLARKAKSITRGASISSWLFTTARFVCKEMIRNDMRRRRREEAAAMVDSHATQSKEWDLIEPQLNDALSTLGASDREAVLMRYYSGMSLFEIAGQIGTTEDTARKRVSRAVDKLRHYFQREQATAHLLSLDALLATYCAGSVPAHTHATVMSTLHNLGVAQGAPAALNSHAGVLLKKGVIVLMDTTMKKILIGLAVIAVIGAGVGIPVTMAHIHNARLSSQDQAVLIDATPSTEASADAAQARDRSAILGVMQKSTDEYRRRDLSHWVDDTAPGMTVSMPGRPNMPFALMLQVSEQTFQTVGPIKLTDTVNSLQVHGDAADTRVSIHFEGTTIKSANVPAGLKIAQDETEASTWRKENGRWLTTHVDVDNMRTTINGRVINPGSSQTAAR
jgi:RNA polymerase sigma factor (sigma-70 family)